MDSSAESPGDQQDDSPQWTRIVRKGKKLGRQKEVLKSPLGGPPANFRPNGSPQLSVDDIKAHHDKIASKWRETKSYQQSCELFKLNAAPHATVTRAVCLGVGPFDPQDGSWVAQQRSHTQLAAFRDIVQVLAKESGQDIECFYQEPLFAQPDKDFIASIGGKVVESPAAYDLINETSLIFGVHLYRGIWAAALKKSLPGIFVGTGWDVWEENSGADILADLERIREMDATFDKFLFPPDDYSSFSSTCIYWKKRGHDSRDDVQSIPAVDQTSNL